MNWETQLKVAVLGSASARDDSAEAAKAERIGHLVASQGAVLLTGGCPGLPHAAVHGARTAGGLTVAISPGANGQDHTTLYGYPADSEVIIFTGMGTKGRNVVLVRSADACIFVGGGMGTLNEFTIAFDDLGLNCAIGVLAGSGGLSDEFPTLASRVPRPCRAILLVAPSPDQLVEKVFHHLREYRGGGGQ